jgi:hypothetical protein
MALQLYKIAFTEVGSAGSSSIAFSNIPQGYTDLMLVSSVKDSGTGNIYAIKAAYTGTGTLSSRYVSGAGSSGGTGSGTQSWVRAGSSVGTYTASNNAFASSVHYIPNYTSANAKIGLTDEVGEGNQDFEIMALTATLNTSTTAISSITLTSESGGSFVQYSTFTLYGIL